MRAVWELDQLFDDGFAPDFKAVVTGVTNKKIFAKGLRHPERFAFMEYVERDFLELLTKEAYAFVYPSLNEGFGYPPVESMKYGVPVAASGSTSIPEVCGDAAIYFDPRSVSEMKNRLVQMLDKSVYEEYSKRAKARYEIVAKKQKEDLAKLAEYIVK